MATITIVQKNRQKTLVDKLPDAQDADEAYQQFLSALKLNNIQSNDVRIAQYDINNKMAYCFWYYDGKWNIGKPTA